MVKTRDTQLHVFGQAIDVDTWLAQLTSKLDDQKINLLRNACILAKLAGETETNFLGESCFHQGLVMADILANINADQQTIAAAIIHSSVQYADLRTDDVNEHLGKAITDLITGVKKMDAVNTFEQYATPVNQDHTHINNLRHMLLAMVEDVRVVLIKLAERTYMLRAATIISDTLRKRLAQETLDIYAPLASRLGIAQIKWELEDLAFRYLQPDTYKNIAKMLDQRRVDREQYVADFIITLQAKLNAEQVTNAHIYGRAKHIHSIYRKMQRKNIDFNKVYDATAVRILVNTTEECYKALSCVHSLWEHIKEEFDDYITTPKPNGYRSIHTVIRGPNARNVEVQIRTRTMHDECELGMAAHWVYKEEVKAKLRYEQKIAWLRQVLEWQNDLVKSHQPIDATHTHIFDDRIYVFTPAGHVLDLPSGATALDFAYHIHSDVGHRCRGAKVNNRIVPLTYLLQTGEQIEIITGKTAAPSRDWLNPNLHYLKSSRAKAKIHHWFKQQDYQQHLAQGEAIYIKESKRLHLKDVDLNKIAIQLHYKTKQDLLAALGCGDVRIAQLLNIIQQASLTPITSPISQTPPSTRPKPATNSAATNTADILINGVSGLLTYIAKCCHPIPGDPIVGYITIGRGVTIHQQHCQNISKLNQEQQQRIVEVDWGQHTRRKYKVNLIINTHSNTQPTHQITQLLSAEKLPLLSLSTTTMLSNNTVQIELSVEISDLKELKWFTERLRQIPGVTEVNRITG